MGLDQYLKKKTYIGAYFDHRQVEGSLNITIDGQKVPIDFKRVSEITEQVGYWRKANQIHRWFVENVQEGEDDCREYEVSIDHLKRLLHDCKKVKESIVEAPEVLPTQGGFFFGPTDYDEEYWYEIDYTIEIVEKILEENENNVRSSYPSYYYQSSW